MYFIEYYYCPYILTQSTKLSRIRHIDGDIRVQINQKGFKQMNYEYFISDDDGAKSAIRPWLIGSR